MPNPFDFARLSALNIVKDVFSNPAEWTPSAGGAPLTARVLFNHPTDTRRHHRAEYNPLIHSMEYHLDEFPGLFESLRDGGAEFVTIEGRQYEVREVLANFDGKTYVAQLHPL
jgi:hypothetical protein